MNNFIFAYIFIGLIYVGYAAYIIPKKVEIQTPAFIFSLIVNFLIWPVLLGITIVGLFKGNSQKQ